MKIFRKNRTWAHELNIIQAELVQQYTFVAELPSNICSSQRNCTGEISWGLRNKFLQKSTTLESYEKYKTAILGFNRAKFNNILDMHNLKGM